MDSTDAVVIAIYISLAIYIRYIPQPTEMSAEYETGRRISG